MSTHAPRWNATLKKIKVPTKTDVKDTQPPREQQSFKKMSHRGSQQNAEGGFHMWLSHAEKREALKTSW